VSTRHMPEEFKGKCTRTRITCGICGKLYSFRPREFGETWRARKAARGMGWTFRDDLGWCCPCRHLCENLPQNKRADANHHGRGKRRARV